MTQISVSQSLIYIYIFEGLVGIGRQIIERVPVAIHPKRPVDLLWILFMSASTYSSKLRGFIRYPNLENATVKLNKNASRQLKTEPPRSSPYLMYDLMWCLTAYAMIVCRFAQTNPATWYIFWQVGQGHRAQPHVAGRSLHFDHDHD